MSSTPRPRRKLGRAVTAGGIALFACAMMATPAAADPSTSPSDTPSAAASGSGAAAGAHDKSVFVIGLRQDVDSLNPYVGILASAFDSYQMMYDYLTDVSPTDMSVVPSLATSWDISPDNLKWTFHIRHGVKWSDGQDLTATDVAFSYNRALVPDSTEFGQYGSGLANVTKVEATDPYTVVITTSKPSATLLAASQSEGVPIVPEHIWKNIPESKVATFPNTDHPVSSGPFRLIEAKKGQFYRFAANTTYWNGAPHISELDMRIYDSDETMSQALQKGDIDFITDLSSSSYNGLKNQKDPNITLNSGPSTYTYELGFNNGAATVDGKAIGDGNPALKDKLVREAIDYAIDKKTIVSKILQGAGTVAYGEISPIFAANYWQPSADEKRDYDPAKAKALLDQAGYKVGSNGVRTTPDGKPLTLRMFGRSDNQESQTELQYIQEWLKDVGLSTKVSIMSEDALTDVIGKGNYDMFQWDWGFGPDPDGTLSVFACDARSTEDSSGAIAAGYSDSFYCNPQFEALYAQQKAIVDPAQRTAVVKQAVQNLYDNAEYSVLYYGNTLEAYRNDRFTGYISQPKSGGALASQLGTWSYRAIRPVTAKAASKSSLPLVLAVTGGVVVLALVASGIVFTRRRSTADERE
jgi:peptide/nickel transport system substrate-binding protein